MTDDLAAAEWFGGAYPDAADVDAADAAAARLGWALDWSRVAGDRGIRWRMTARTPRGLVYLTADSADEWRAGLRDLGLAE